MLSSILLGYMLVTILWDMHMELKFKPTLVR